MSKRAYSNTILLIFLSFLICIALPGKAWATQIHPPEEGVIVHNLGHCCFVISMGILIYWLRQRGLTRERGWRFIQYSAFFFILWNIDALIVHYFEDITDIFEIQGSGRWNLSVHDIYGHDALGLLYYFARMDHLLCVPAIILLYIGLRHLLKHPGPSGFRGQHP